MKAKFRITKIAIRAGVLALLISLLFSIQLNDLTTLWFPILWVVTNIFLAVIIDLLIAQKS